MKEGPTISAIAALIGDPARANMLTALMDGRALTVTELAELSGVTLPTASGHLSKLDSAGLLKAEKQGRHRYFRLSGADVGDVLERLMSLAQRTGSVRVRTGPKDSALRTSRVCYDHMAGERGVAMLDALKRHGHVRGDDDLAMTGNGRSFFAELGVDVETLEKARRPLCRGCLDWSERRPHLAGSLGAALLSTVLARGWARKSDNRVLTFTPPGGKAFDKAFGI